jgi:hypothetical protein
MSRIGTVSICPVCGNKLDAATPTDKESGTPSSGDISICIYCATISVFDDKLKLSPITNEEFAKLPEELKISVRKARDTILEFNVQTNYKKS